jgi:putative two-component system response regulator
MALISAELGNVGEALVQYSKALEISRELRDIEDETKLLNNLGTALNYAGLYREAIPCFQRVLSVVKPNWKFPVERRSLANLAQSYYYLEDFEKALEAAERSVRPDPDGIEIGAYMSRTIREFTLIQIALELDRYALASEHVDRCRTAARLADSAPCRLMAEIASARLEVRGGRVRDGLTALDRILVESRFSDSIYRDALIAIVKAYDEAGRPDTALAYMQQLLQHVRERTMRCLDALVTLPDQQLISRASIFAEGNLKALECRHAELRAKVAERGANAMRIELLERLAATADLREDASGQHGYRVGALSALLAREIGMTSEAAERIEQAARLHDFGKTAIPEHILGSSESLKDAERHMMSLHTVVGAELLAKSNVSELRMAQEIARYHHEWWDGTGYPDKLEGRRIPIHARIVALADVLDALTHGRPYAEPWSVDRALQEIRDRRGTQFDPVLTDHFLAMIDRLHTGQPDLDAYLGKAALRSPFQQARETIRGLLSETQGFETAPVLH